MATERGNKALVGKLIEKKADLNLRDAAGDTALIIAARRGNDSDEEIAEMLIEAGAKLDLKNKEGHSALFFAAKGNHFNIARMLVGKGAKTEID
jgi:ankyrin repeat protein